MAADLDFVADCDQAEHKYQLFDVDNTSSPKARGRRLRIAK